ncbi:MAG: hypothetical protein Q8R07_03585, partial [Candidatus Uhrbacteria bacterium]|nr:hypothetical protein [Candidatus Uhrbacteria bacterium]
MLADSFTEAAKANGLFNAEVERIAGEIRSGATSIEEGIIALNELRTAAGLAKLELKDLTLDASSIQAQIEMIQALFEGIGEAAKDGIAAGITQGLSAVDVAKNFRKTFYLAIVDTILEGFVAGFMRASMAVGPLAAAMLKIGKLIQDYISGAIGQNEYITGITGALGEVKPLIERIAEAIGIASDQFTEMLRAAGILPEILDEAADAGKELAKSLRDAARDLLLDSRLSPLKPRERVAQAQTEFETLRRQAMAGDRDAAGQLPEAARRYLEEARNVYASSAAYEAIFDFVRQTLLDVADKFGAAEDVGERQLRTLEEIRDELRKLTTGTGPLNTNAPIDHPPALAAGGIVTRPTYARIGEGGPEAILPLSRLWDMLRALALGSGDGAERRSRALEEMRDELRRLMAGTDLPSLFGKIHDALQGFGTEAGPWRQGTLPESIIDQLRKLLTGGGSGSGGNFNALPDNQRIWNPTGGLYPPLPRERYGADADFMARRQSAGDAIKGLLDKLFGDGNEIKGLLDLMRQALLDIAGKSEMSKGIGEQQLGVLVEIRDELRKMTTNKNSLDEILGKLREMMPGLGPETGPLRPPGTLPTSAFSFTGR